MYIHVHVLTRTSVLLGVTCLNKGLDWNKVLWSVVCGTISGIITAWLVFKFLGGKGCGPKGAREEIGEVKDEPNDLNNPADKLPQENDERLDKRAEEHEEMRY